MSALSIATPQPRTMDLVREMECLLDSLEMTEGGSAERAEAEADLAALRAQLARKVDNGQAVFTRLEARAAAAAKEIARLQKRKSRAEAEIENLEALYIAAIQELPVPAKGPRRIEGENVTFRLSPSERGVTPEPEKVPLDYQRATIKMPALEWRLVMEASPIAAAASVQYEIQLAPVKKAIKAGVEVPGADIQYFDNLRRI